MIWNHEMRSMNVDLVAFDYQKSMNVDFVLEEECLLEDCLLGERGEGEECLLGRDEGDESLLGDREGEERLLEYLE